MCYMKELECNLRIVSYMILSCMQVHCLNITGALQEDLGRHSCRDCSKDVYSIVVINCESLFSFPIGVSYLEACIRVSRTIIDKLYLKPTRTQMVVINT